MEFTQEQISEIILRLKLSDFQSLAIMACKRLLYRSKFTLREIRSYFLSNKGKYAPYPWASMSSLGIKRREALLIQ